MKGKSIIFIDSYYKGLYGAPKSMLELAIGVKDKVDNVTIISSKDDHLLAQARKENLFSVSLDIPERALISRTRLSIFGKIMYLISILRVWFKCLFKDPLKYADVICVNDIRSFLFLLPILYKSRKKVIWYVRINDRVKFISALATKLSSRIILISKDCSSAFTDKELMQHNEKFSVINTGFDPDFTNVESINTNHRDNDFVFISVGSICKRKNQLSVVEAFNSVRLHNKHLYLIGSPTSKDDEVYLQEVIELVESLGLKSLVTFVSYTNSVNSYLLRSDVFLFASYKEGLPRVLIEAQLAGCFVVSAKVDGVFDIIKDNDMGVVTSSKANEYDFLNEFKKLANQSTNVEKCSRLNIAAKAKERFSYSKFVSLFLDVCNKE